MILCDIDYFLIYKVHVSLFSQVVDQNNYGNDNCAKEFSIKVMNQLSLADARVLPPPTVNMCTYMVKLI
jgi:hypothetical protein